MLDLLALLQGAQAGGNLPQTMPQTNTPIMSPTEEAEIGVSAAPGPPKTGMFGVKGTFRDILGVLGDAFLTQAKRDAVYAPQRQREKLSGAMGGFFGGEGRDQRAALETMAQQGFVDEASKLWDTAERRRLDKVKNQKFGYDRFGAYSASLAKGGEGAWDQGGRARLQSIVDDYDLPIEVPEKYDPAFLSGAVTGGMSSYQAQKLSLEAENIGSQVQRRTDQTRLDGERVGIQRDNVGSQIETRAGNLGVARTNAATNQRKAKTYQQATDQRGQPPAKTGKVPTSKDTFVKYSDGKVYRVINGKPEVVTDKAILRRLGALQ